MMTAYRFDDLENASVFITGGGSGIGAALTEGFLQQGAQVAFVGRNVEGGEAFCDEMQARYERRPLFLPCDVRDVDALRAAMRQAGDAHGPITVLVNNAARDDRHGLQDLSPEQWSASLDLNLRPHFFTAQTAAPAMREAGGGAVINLSSNSFLLGLSGYPAYVTAKAGIHGLTKALARELGPDRIRVNCLIPGWVMTARQKELWVTEEAIQDCLEAQCLKETIDPADVAASCLFLASSASRMISGQMLVVDGGRY